MRLQIGKEYNVRGHYGDIQWTAKATAALHHPTWIEALKGVQAGIVFKVNGQVIDGVESVNEIGEEL